MHPMLNVAVKAARRAGAIINRASLDLDKLTITAKRHNDFVSEVDRSAEDAIISTIFETYPDHAILAEESGPRGKSDYLWTIDPLDGTTNFLHGAPPYCVSIAVSHRGVLTHGVVFDPTRNDLFTASRGGGAFLNDRRIRVSKTTRLESALISTGFPFRDLKNLDQYLAMLRAVTMGSAGVRRHGAAALDLAYVACGRFDGFWELGLCAWDLAAGALLIQEAGGLAADLDGNPTYLDSGNIVCGSPKVFGQLLKLIEPLRPRAGDA
jgi:myo-inositol-1(or 4)-monophosphatase